MDQRDDYFFVDEPRDDGRVWTSYSDLFVTVSIIFLVMFVFSMLKSNLSSLRAAMTQKEVTSYLDGVLTPKKKKEFTDNRNTIKKDLTEIREQVAQINQRKKELDQFAAQLVQHQGTVDRVLKEQAKRDAVISHISKEVLRQKEQARIAETQLKAERKQRTELASQLKELRKQLNRAETKNTALAKSELAAQKQLKAQKKVAASNEKALSQTEKLLAQVARLKIEKAERAKELKLVADLYEQQEATIAKLQGDLEAAEQGQAGREARLAERRSFSRGLGEDLRSVPGALMSLNCETGNLTLNVDKTFFENDSFKIAKGTRSMLRSVIPIYAKSLYSNKKMWKRIKSIRVIGHASPRFKSKPVDPTLTKSRAFKYNQFLSQRRAENIANHIKSIELQDKNYESEFYKKIKFEGKSYSEPLLSMRSPASKTGQGCGKYDCEKSRRVEIVLEFENEIERKSGHAG